MQIKEEREAVGELVFAYTRGIVYIAIFISTAVFDVLSYLIKWFLEKEEADKINKKIEERRNRKNGGGV